MYVLCTDKLNFDLFIIFIGYNFICDSSNEHNATKWWLFTLWNILIILRNMDRHNIKSDHFRGVLWLANPSKLYASFEPFWKV